MDKWHWHWLWIMSKLSFFNGMMPIPALAAKNNVSKNWFEFPEHNVFVWYKWLLPFCGFSFLFFNLIVAFLILFSLMIILVFLLFLSFPQEGKFSSRNMQVYFQQTKPEHHNNVKWIQNDGVMVMVCVSWDEDLPGIKLGE